MSLAAGTYAGNCHCGAFKFNIKLPLQSEPETCNCSVCAKKGCLWLLTDASTLRVEKGTLDELRSYEFGMQSMTHKFCSKCGTPVLILREHAPEGAWTLSLNVRALNDVDIEALKPKTFDGASIEPTYQLNELKNEAFSADLAAGQIIHSGNCHCQAVKFLVKTKPLSEVQVNECNCSVCSRNGYVNFYPAWSSVLLEGKEHLQSYIIKAKPYMAHLFCKTCGTPMFVETIMPPAEVTADWDAKKISQLEEDMKELSITIRVLNGVEWEKLKIYKYNGRANPPLYTVE